MFSGSSLVLTGASAFDAALGVEACAQGAVMLQTLAGGSALTSQTAACPRSTNRVRKRWPPVRRCLSTQLASLLCLQLLGVSPAWARGSSANQRLLVPGGTARLLQVVGIRAPVEPERAFLVIVRALHPVSSAGAGLGPAVQAHLAAAAQAKAGGDRIPALLPHAVWEQAVFGRKVGADDLAARILGDRRAALLYYGLFSLDDETLAFFVDRMSLVRTICQRDAGPFAVFAEAVAVHDGRVQLPGGTSSADRWEALVGASAADPEAFIPRLLHPGRGRLAWLFDTIGRLDAAHQVFAIGRGRDDLRSLYASFAGFDDGWNIAETPFRRLSPLDPGLILQRIAVTPDGEMAPPGERALWQAVFDDRHVGSLPRQQGLPDADTGTPESDGDANVTAAWLVDRFRAMPARTRRARLDSVLFAQRLFADGAHGRVAADADVLLETLSAFPAHQALITTLERMGFARPLDYERAVQAAGALTAGFDRFQQSLRLATFQGALALVARLDAVGVLDPGTARDLCTSLLPLASSDEISYPGAVAGWVETVLLPALPERPAATSASADARLIEALAGVSIERPTPILEWEDRFYRVDIAAAEHTRLRRILRKQGGNDLDGALELHHIISRITGTSSSADDVRSLASRLLDIIPTLIPEGRSTLFGFDIAGTRDAVLTLVRQIREGRADAKSADAGQRLATGLAVVLADVLASHAYAVALGDPEGPLLLVENPARRHDFGLAVGTRSGPWVVASVTRVGSASVASGSLLALERALARYWLRATTLRSPVARPILWELEIQGLAESVAAFDPFRLTDEDRDALVGALRRGRDRLSDAAGRQGDIDHLAATAGVDGWRRRLIRGAAAADPAAVAGYFSLGEALGLGLAGPVAPNLHAWGLSTRAIDGSLERRLPCRLAWTEMAGRPGLGLLTAQIPDLQLRVAEWLAELKLPAVLAPGVMSFAMWDLAMGTQMADQDDWLAVLRTAQGLSADRMADHVSALTANGPLIPVAK